jgi:hypothetical protein
MDIAFVLGNGISRRGLPLHDMSKYGHIYGCNALFRDFTPHVLVATDKPIAMHIEETGYPKTNKFYTRRPTEGSGALVIPKTYYGFSSGPVAVALAALERYPRIYLLGFDVGPNENQQFNNLYASTEFYKAEGSTATYTGNWTKQIKKICQDFQNTKFIRVCGNTTARLQELDTIKNLEHLPLARFVDRLNKLKDF